MTARRIVVVGGGAGGAELATKLGDKYGRKDRAQVTLVDRSRTHLWKPLLHEVAAGSMDMHDHQLDYLAQARWHRFTFALGALAGLDRAAPRDRGGARDRRRGPARSCRSAASPTTRSVIAIGSESNDFGHAGRARARVHHRQHLAGAPFPSPPGERLLPRQLRGDGEVIDIAIVGAGATGVELAAELHNTIRVLAAYGLDNFDPANARSASRSWKRARASCRGCPITWPTER